MRFSEQAFIVTGGGSGIGRGIVKRLTEEGARVMILDVDTHSGNDAVEEYGDRVLFLKGSVASEPTVKKAVAATVRWAGRLDGIVNNAGIADPEIGPLEELSLATWQKFIDVNLTGAFLVAKHAAPHLRSTKGAIVNISSSRAVMSEPHTEPYSATKGGLLALTHALSISLGPDVRVNCVSPGWIVTDELKARDQRKKPQLSKKDNAQHPVGRVGVPDDIAAAVAFLLSSEAGFITGQNLVIDGGMTRKMIYV
ncbi:MAG TPA: glucose 1-dehydrogenase [Kofleriaceae bacterium]|jgi:NAD(P)-dependent dehydrogenase (short-subunit alcohol dehydrogenase family)